MLWNIAINDAGADYDPLTLLRSRTMFGRPDWKTIYGRMRQAIESGQYLPGTNSQLKTTVGVCYMLAFLISQLTRALLDLFLWPYTACEGHQGSDIAALFSFCQLHIRKGAFLRRTCRII
jgi:hypothetical protein